ncbi:hypothetical protein ACU4IU_00370 [Brevibacterium sp. CSND-B09]|uniref:hypothetical protein n=1 Tax=Brevibacterium sp. CSND-B09 TaxID=3462571 RepID=UPI00406A648F
MSRKTDAQSDVRVLQEILTEVNKAITILARAARDAEITLDELGATVDNMEDE